MRYFKSQSEVDGTFYDAIKVERQMIERTETIEIVKPIFGEYLNYVSQFYEIKNYGPWCDGAIKNLQRYSVEEGRYIYILIESGSVIGFALVNKHLRFNHDGFAIAEFYIQNEQSRKGYGRKLAEHVFAQFPGHWEIAVALKNNSALVFWKQVVSSYTNGTYLEKKTDTFSGSGFVFNNE